MKYVFNWQYYCTLIGRTVGYMIFIIVTYIATGQEICITNNVSKHMSRFVIFQRFKHLCVLDNIFLIDL